MVPEIRNLITHPVSGKEDDSFVGIKAVGNQVNFFYPEAFDLSKDPLNKRLEIIALIKTIKIAKSQSENTFSTFRSTEKGCDFALESYLWIINDYLTNGFYTNSEKCFVHSPAGKVNWKRTLQTEPLVSKNKKLVYLDIISSIKNSSDNLLVEIYKCCVKKAIDYIGWLFNLSAASIYVPKLSIEKKKEYIMTLKSELERTFDDEKKLRLENMANIIKGLDINEKERDFIYGVDNYHYIYERMVDYVFGGQEDIQSFYPRGEWRLINHPGQVFNSSNLRPDTILLLNRDSTSDVFVLDSKFYRFGTTGLIDDLPETTSIQKQITYGDFIKKNSESRVGNVYSAFILPYNKNSGPYKSDDNLQYIGKASSTWKDGKDTHNIIYTFLIDLRYLVLSWYKHKNDEMPKKIVKSILDLAAEEIF